MTVLFPEGFLIVAGLSCILLFVHVLSQRTREKVLKAFVAKTPSSWRDTVALVVLSALLAISASRPALVTHEPLVTRTDAAMIFLFDVSGSFYAQENPNAPSRMERAKAIALNLYSEFSDVPTGVSAFIDRPLPHLPPITDERLVRYTITRVVDVGSVPAKTSGSSQGSSTEVITSVSSAVQKVAEAAYFPEHAAKKILVVFTDGETNVTAGDLAIVAQELLDKKISLVVVGVGNNRDLIFLRDEYGNAVGLDPHIPKTDFELLRSFATAAQGVMVEEEHAGQLGVLMRPLLGIGPTETIGTRAVFIDASPFFLALSLVPFLFFIRKKLT